MSLQVALTLVLPHVNYRTVYTSSYQHFQHSPMKV